MSATYKQGLSLSHFFDLAFCLTFGNSTLNFNPSLSPAVLALTVLVYVLACVCFKR